MTGGNRFAQVLSTGSMPPLPVADECCAPGLVHRDPVVGEVAERSDDQTDVLGEQRSSVPSWPASCILERLRRSQWYKVTNG